MVEGKNVIIQFWLTRRERMLREKKTRKTHITIETDERAFNWIGDGDGFQQEDLSPIEWNMLEELFARHPKLLRVDALERRFEDELMVQTNSLQSVDSHQNSTNKAELSTAMNLKLWIFFFIHGLRYEAERTPQNEIVFLGKFSKEQTLSKPCQVEAIVFNDPYRFVLLFFFDHFKPDLAIRVHKAQWEGAKQIISKLLKKYSTLWIKPSELEGLLERAETCPNGISYGIDVVRNVFVVYFTYDPREKVAITELAQSYLKPEDLAQKIFRLNVGQSSSYFPH
jgi:hypothetical protein